MFAGLFSAISEWLEAEVSCGNSPLDKLSFPFFAGADHPLLLALGTTRLSLCQCQASLVPRHGSRSCAARGLAGFWFWQVFTAALSPQLLASLSTGCLFHQHQGWNPTGPFQTGSPVGHLWENMTL